MLKLLRKGAIENIWFYRIIMIIISLAFVITMGWWGFGGPPEQHVVAKVGDTAITLDQYQQAYDNAYRFYRDLFKDQFSDDLVKQLDLKRTVINNLVERELWLLSARQMRLKVTDQELLEHIMKQQAFHRDGRFDTEVYKRRLAGIRYTPEVFERLQREDLMVEKARVLVKGSVAVTAAELNEAKATNPSADQDPLQGLLLRKQQLAQEAYLNSLKSRVPITINDKML